MWIEQLSSGKYKFFERYEDPLSGKLKRVSITLDKDTASARKSAQAELARKIEEKKQSCTSCKSDLTLYQLYNSYIAYQSDNCKESTVCRNKTSINQVINMLGYDTIVNKLTAQYVKDVFKSNNVPQQKAKEYITRFKAMLNWGFENELHDNTSLALRLKAPKGVSDHLKVKDKFLEPEELSELLAYIQNNGMTDWYYLTQFLVLSGLRVGEAIALCSKDIDDYIHVRNTYDSNNKIITTAKTDNSMRDVYVQPELKTLIKQINLYEKEKRLLYGVRSDYFMCNKKGDVLSYYAYLKYIRESAKRIHLAKKVTPHIFRHTHASMLVAQGVSVDAITRRLGHSDSRVTRQIYLHVTKQLQALDNSQISATKIL